jgi:hypothetical protein
MAIKLRTKRPDRVLKQIIAALKEYEVVHPRAEIEVYRHSSVSVRIRIINPEFKHQSRAEREDELWRIFDRLPEEVPSEITVLLLLAPEEKEKSIANFDFENPIPSEL